MSSISTTINHGVTLGQPGYLSPLTITSTGYVNYAGAPAAVYSRPSGTVVNYGGIRSGTGNNAGVELLAVGSNLYNHGAIVSNWYGVYIYGGLVTNSGTITSSNRFGVFGRGGSLSIANSGVISGSEGIHALSGVTISNTGTIRGSVGVHVSGGIGSILNSSVIAAAYGNGVVLDAGGTITNTTTGYISSLGEYAGVSISGGAGVVDNSGTISGHSGIVFYAGGIASQTVIDSGTIVGSGGTAVAFGAGNDLLRLQPSTLLVHGIADGGGGANTLEFTSAASAGTLTGAAADFVNFAKGTVDAGAQWSIAGNVTMGAGIGLTISGTVTVAGTLENAGSISPASYAGLQIAAGGYLLNDASGTIINNTGQSHFNPTVRAVNATNVTVVNLGAIEDPAGNATIYLMGGGTVVNGSAADTSALISGPQGVYAYRDTATVTNFGSIVSNIGLGLALIQSGVVTNGAAGSTSALVHGGEYGVFMVNGSGTVTNFGTISSNDYAIKMVGGDGTVIDSGLIAASTAITFGGSGNLLVLEHGYTITGTIAAAGGGNVIEVLGRAGAAVAANYNSLNPTNFHTIEFAPGAGNYASLTITNNATLPGTITNFSGAHDTIDLTALTYANGATGTRFNTVTHQLTVTAGASSVTLQLGGGNYTGIGWLATNDGGTGTDIAPVTLTPPVIGGTAAGQTVNDNATDQPFSGVTVTDGNPPVQTETLTITLTNGGAATDADGILSGSGLSKTGTGTYTLTASGPAAATSDLDALVFTPTAHQVAPGDTITTGFTIGATDTSGLSTSDSTTTVVTTATAPGTPTIIASGVSTVAALNLAIEAADSKVANSGTLEIDLASGGTIALGTTALEAINLNAGNPLVIEGDNATIDGGGTQRGLFDFSGSLIVANLTIADTAAIGGAGGPDAGGGAGLGGGLFIAAAGSVTLRGVTFTGDSAVGGAGGGALSTQGGGGGLGGAGGGQGGGGGGIGTTATGGDLAHNGGPGIVPGVASGGSGEGGTTGGIDGGGGGYDAGGGVGGGASTFVNAGNGGFGGGGGAVVNAGTGGIGGFGGGGGYGDGDTGNIGGFGGGGGGGNVFVGGAGGFGGGIGGNASSGLGDQRGGGGGLGAGGAIFVQQGGQLTLGYGGLSGGSVQNGAAGVSPHGTGDAKPGSAFGTGIFIQGTQSIDFAPSAGQTLTVSDVIADQSGSGGTGTLAGAGSVIINGAGLVDLTADDTYTGGTTIEAGTLFLNGGTAGGKHIDFAPSANAVLAAGVGDAIGNTIGGFVLGDTIILQGITSTSATLGTGNVLTVHQSGGGSVTLNLATGEDFGGDNFIANAVTFEGVASTQITLQSQVAPVIGGTAAGQTVNDDATDQPFSGVTITDGNPPTQTETIAITLTHGGTPTDADGRLSGSGLSKTGTGTYTLTASDPATATSDLNAIVFTPTAHQVAPGGTITTGITIGVTDTDGASANDSTTTVIATAVNDPPVISGTVAGQTTTDEATITPFSGVAISDVDFGQTETVTITLSAKADGSLSNAGTGGYNAGTGVYTVTGTDAAVTTAVDGLVFTPAAHQVVPGASVTTTFTISATDTAGGTTGNGTTTVLATAVNDAPVISGTVSGQMTTDEATITPFSGVSISDVDFGQTETVTIALSATADGSLSNVGTGNYNAAAGVYTVTGTDAAVTAAVDGLVFTPTAHQVAPGASVTTAFTITATDTADGTSGNNTTSVLATAVNDPPAISGTVSGQTTTDEATITPFSGVSISDVDFDQTETVTITLSAKADGALSNVGTGNYNAGKGVYTVTGTDAAVTTAVDGLVFTPTAHQVAPGASVTTTFTIAATDTAGGTSSNSTTTVGATAGNDAPVITGTASGQNTTDEAAIAPFSGVTIGDSNPPVQTETITITLTHGGTATDADGALSGTGLSKTGTGTYALTASGPAAATSVLDALVFTPAAHQTAPGGTVVTGFTLAVSDSAGLSASDSATSVDAMAVNDPPVISGTVAGQTLNDNATDHPFSGASISDPDFGSPETVTITLTSGGIASDANGALSGTGLTKTGIGTYTLAIGTPAEVTAALQALTFTPTDHEVAPGDTVTTGMTLSVTDGIVSSPTTNATTSVVVTALGATPSISGTVANQGVPNQTASNPFSGVTETDPSFGAIDTVTVTLSAPGNGTFSNLSSGSYNAGTGVYSVTGSPAAVTAALRALVFTPIEQPGAYITTTGFAISPGGGGAVDTVTSVTSVEQILGLAAVPLNQIAISVSPDGSSFAPAAGGMTNEAVVSAPVQGATYTIPTGYQAAFLGGTAGATLSDASDGDALLVANAGNDTLIAGAANDVLVAGGGNDSLFGGGFAGTVVGGAGTANVFAGTGALTVTEGTGSLMFSGANNNASTIFGAAGAGADSLAATLSGASQMVSAGASAATVAASGSGALVTGGTQLLSITDTGRSDTFQAGAGGIGGTLSGSAALVLGRIGNPAGALNIVDDGSNDTISAGNSAATISGGAGGSNLLVIGGTGNLSFVGGTGGATVVGGTGPTSISAGANGGPGGVVYDVGSSNNSTVNTGASGTATVFGAANTQVNVVGGGGGTVVAGGGNETLNAAGSTGAEWLSVNTSVTGSAAGTVVMTAGSGNDTLIAGDAAGSYDMTGGSGSDAFVFFAQAAGGAKDIVNNFNPSADVVFIEGYAGGGSAAALQGAASTGAGGVTLTLSDGTTITFANLTNASQLDGRVRYG